MRFSEMLSVAALTAAMFAAPAGAAELQYGRAGVPPKLPDLGPAGNGRRLYVELNCGMCHGGNGAGQTGPNIQGAESGDLNEALKHGIPEAGMPTYGKYVTATDIANLGAYLRSVGTANEPKWWDWWLPHPKI